MCSNTKNNDISISRTWPDTKHLFMKVRCVSKYRASSTKNMFSVGKWKLVQQGVSKNLWCDDIVTFIVLNFFFWHYWYSWNSVGLVDLLYVHATLLWSCCIFDDVRRIFISDKNFDVMCQKWVFVKIVYLFRTSFWKFRYI